MKAIGLWRIDKDDAGKPKVCPIEIVEQTETEAQLEEVLTRCPELLMSDLKLIGRQTETAGGPLDLIGVDGDGHLVVFELKRGALSRDAVAQVIDYASYLSELEPEELSKHISEKSGNLGIEKIPDFLAWYQEQFGKSLPYHQKPRMVLVGLGADDRTRRMVSFLADSDIDISLLTFHGFKQDSTVLLARQIEIQAKKPTTSTAVTKRTNLEKLQQRVTKVGVDGFYYELAEFFRSQIPGYEWPNPGGFSYYLTEMTETGTATNRVYVSLYIYDAHPGKIEIRLHGRAVEAAGEGFQTFSKTAGVPCKQRSDGGVELWIKSRKEWDSIKPGFQELCPLILEGCKRNREKKAAEEFKEAEQTSSELAEIEEAEV